MYNAILPVTEYRADSMRYYTTLIIHYGTSKNYTVRIGIFANFFHNKSATKILLQSRAAVSPVVAKRKRRRIREIRRNRRNFRHRRQNARIQINHHKRPLTARLIGTLIASDEPPIPPAGRSGLPEASKAPSNITMAINETSELVH